MSDTEEVKKMVNKPGTFSQVVELPLEVLLKEGILRKKQRSGDYAISFHLATEKYYSLFWKGSDFSFDSVAPYGWLGIILNEKFTEIITKGISKELISKEKFIEFLNKGRIKLYGVEWDTKIWLEIETYLKGKGIEIYECDESDTELYKGRAGVFGQYLFTLAALENLVRVYPDWGVRAYFIDKTKTLRPIEKIDTTFMKAIVKEVYTEDERELIQKNKKRIIFYKYDSTKREYTRLE